MFTMDSKYGTVKVYAKTIEEEAVAQVCAVANSPVGENAHIRIMPDAHAGAGCVIGTTMVVTDKVCPNLVGVDIGCGVDFVKTDIDFIFRLDELDKVIREKIPFGTEVHNRNKAFPFEELRCWDKLTNEVKTRARKALGTLGGGNHFIEAYENGGLAVHSGSRNIGLAVAKYYQRLAEKRIIEHNQRIMREELMKIEPAQRETWIKANKIVVNADLAYLTGQDMQDYLHDVAIMQDFANKNRFEMLNAIVNAMGGKILQHIESIHNYIDLSDENNIILRKGAISAKRDEILVIPLNMRDGILICKGKGNADWNCSAPHGAGRLYSRSKAKEIFTVTEYEESMVGIYTTCVNECTLDEAPFVYKDYQEIMECIEPTVEILERITPIFNFKAN